jgi:putative ABC transport system ATP-binding protein
VYGRARNHEWEKRFVIYLEKISRVYGAGAGATHALREVTLTVATGAFVTIVGTSGSGKTTLLNIIGGLDTDYQGRALVSEKDLRSLSDAELSRFRNHTVGFVFQHFHLLDHLDALQNVALPSFFGTDTRDTLSRAEEVLTRVGLKEKLRSFPSQLSGGQKQRVAIARALFSQPHLMLCDEPTGNLDSHTSAQIIALFESLNRDDKITVMVVTHEASLFSSISQTVHIEDGRLVGGDAA